MKKQFLISCLLAFVVQVKAQSAADVIDKYITAIGGRDSIKSINTMKIQGSTEVGPGIQMPFVNYMKRPGKMKVEATFQGMTQQMAISNDSGWQINPFLGAADPQPLDEDNLRIMKEQSDFESPLVDYKEKGYTATLIGREDFEGDSVFKIKLEDKKGNGPTYYINSQTYLPVKKVQQLKFSGSEIESEVIYTDYRPEAGVMMAHAFEQTISGQVASQKFIFTTVEVNVPIDDSIFEMPAQLPGGQK
jgi:outer membrane lipoprotein-sorting protein